MADDRLRLVAEVQDGFTGPLAKLETALGRAAKTGTQAGKDLKRDFDGFHGTLGKTTAALQGMTPVLSGLGLAGLTTGVSLGAVTAALSGFSKGTQQLAIMSRETGLAVDQLRAFSALGERFGVSAETMQGGVRKFADEMSQMRKRYGEAYSGLQAMNLGELVEKMVSSPNMKAALDTFMDSVSQIGDPVKRRKVVEMMLGSDQIAAVAGQLTGRYRQVMDEILKAQGQTTDAQVKAAQRFETALSRVRENMDGLRTEALAPLLEQLSALVEKFGSAESMAAFSKQLEKIGKFARTTVQEFEAIVRTYEKFKEFIGLGDPSKNVEFKPLLGGGGALKPMTRGELEGKRDSIEQQRKLLDANPNAPDYARKRDRMTDELRRVGDELEKLRTSGGATAQPSAYGGVPGAGSPLIQRVGFSGSGGGFGGVRPGLGGFGAPLPTMGGGYGGSGGAGGSTGGGYTGNGGVPRGPSAGGSSSSGPLPMGRDVGSAPGISARDMRNVNPEIAAYIRNSAARHGIDPNVALRIANSEGLRGSTPTHMTPGDKGTSFGPFQLHYKSRVPGLTLGGLGDAYTRETGHHASDAQHWKEQIDFAMKNARRSGWGAWHGRIGARVGVWDGIGTYNGPVPSADAAQVADQSAPSASEGSGSVGLDGQVGVDLGNGTMRMPNGRIRSKTNGTGPGPSADAPGSSARMGDRMMQRMYGDQAPVAKGGKGSLDITLHGFPAGAKPRASMDDLFKEVNVSKSRQMETTSI